MMRFRQVMSRNAVAFGVLFGTIVYQQYYYHSSCRESVPRGEVTNGIAELPSQNSGWSPGGADRLNMVHTVELPYERHLYRQFAQMAADKVSHSAPALVSLARRLIDPPAPGPFYRRFFYDPHSWHPVARVVDGLLGNMRGGFFVEVGGYDGVTASTTVHLEQQRRWSGLLIEADPNLYLMLRAHSRACWSINAAVGIKPHADILALDPDPWLGQVGRVRNRSGSAGERVVPMFPLATLLRALNTSTVHFFSLDVEGSELQVLKTLPWSELDIRVLAVEVTHGSGADPLAEYTAFMEGHGYRRHGTMVYSRNPVFVHDAIFVKKL